MCQIDFVVNGRDRLDEVPLWCTRTKRLWWLDVRAPALQSCAPVTRTLREEQLARQPRAGSLMALDVGLRGIAEPRFAG